MQDLVLDPHPLPWRTFDARIASMTRQVAHAAIATAWTGGSAQAVMHAAWGAEPGDELCPPPRTLDLSNIHIWWPIPDPPRPDELSARARLVTVLTLADEAATLTDGPERDAILDTADAIAGQALQR